MKKSTSELYDEFKSKGNECVKQQDFKRALDFYTECIRLDPNQTTAYLNRSLCELKVNDPSAALADSSFVLGKEPDNVKALYRRALALKSLGRLDESVADLERLLGVEPKNQMASDELKKIRDEFSSSRRAPAAAATATTTKPIETKIEITETAASPSLSSSNQSENETKPPTKSSTTTATTTTTTRRAPVKFEPVKVVTTKTYDFTSITNGYEFLQAWNSIKPNDLDNYARLLEHVQPESLPKFIGSKLDDQMFTALMGALNKFDKPDKAVLYLQSLANVQRFGIIKMFMSKDVRDTIANILNSTSSSSAAQSVRNIYEIH